MKTVFDKPESLTDNTSIYCPGCHHGTVHRLVAEALDGLGVRENTLAVAPVGCSVLLYDYFDVDGVEAPHGRAPALATGIKRVRPDMTVFAYQGDGDLASIGMAEIIHAANRGEKITIIFVNNANYGMTGGQMAPTTLPGQKTTTSQAGRNTDTDGFPFRMAEIMGNLPAVAFSARVSVTNPKNVRNAKKMIKKAFEYQVNGTGFGFVEVISSCPTNWGMTPVEANKWVDDAMEAYYPLGTFKDVLGGQ